MAFVNVAAWPALTLWVVVPEEAIEKSGGGRASVQRIMKGPNGQAQLHVQ